MSDYFTVDDPNSVCAYTGGPGSGKSLQCERMEQRFDFRHVTLANLLCVELQSHSDRGHHLQDVLERGEQLPEVGVILLSEYMSLLGIFVYYTHHKMYKQQIDVKRVQIH